MTTRRLIPVVAFLAACLATAQAQNQALSVSNTGTSGWADVTNVAGMTPANLTVEAWCTYDDSTVTPPPAWVFPTLVRKNVGAAGEEYFLRVEAANSGARVLRWRVRTGGGLVTTNWSFAPGELAAWTHVAGTWDGTTARIFINGAQVSSATGPTGPLVDNGGIVKIGAGDTSPTSAAEIWNGELDNVRIWSTARTPAELVSTMFSNVLTDPALVASYTLDFDALDYTGNGHDGTLAAPANFVPATLPIQLYQVNSASADLQINGTASDPFNPGSVSVTAGTSATMNIQSTNVGNLFDVVVTVPSLLVPIGGGAVTSPNGQILNLNIAVPTSLFIFGGSLANPVVSPYPGSLSLPFTATAPISAAAQMIILDPAHLDGFALSGGVNFTAL